MGAAKGHSVEVIRRKDSLSEMSSWFSSRLDWRHADAHLLTSPQALVECLALIAWGVRFCVPFLGFGPKLPVSMTHPVFRSMDALVSP